MSRYCVIERVMCARGLSLAMEWQVFLITDTRTGLFYVCFTFAFLCGVCAQVLRLLCAIHRAGMRHRDIRPDNLMLYDDDIVVIDWLFAVTGGDVAIEYRGSKHFVTEALAASIAIAEDSEAPFSHTFTKLDDLQSWLRTCIVLSNQWVRSDAYRSIQYDTVRHVARLWREAIDGHPLWKAVHETMIRLASVPDDEVDYRELEAMLPLPSSMFRASATKARGRT